MSDSEKLYPEEKENSGKWTETEFHLSKKPAPDDPLRMKAELTAGDPQVMLDCLIEEFARMGWDGEQIWRIFEDPFFMASHGLTKRFGQKVIRERIEQTLKKSGIFHFNMIERNPV